MFTFYLRYTRAFSRRFHPKHLSYVMVTHFRRCQPRHATAAGQRGGDGVRAQGHLDTHKLGGAKRGIGLATVPVASPPRSST